MGTLGVASLVVGMIVCYMISLPMDVAEELALTNEEVVSIAEPAARLLAKSKIPGEVRTTLVNSGDYVALGVAATAYIFRILDLMKGIPTNVATQQSQGIRPVNNAASNGHHTNDTFTVGSVANFGAYGIS